MNHDHRIRPLLSRAELLSSREIARRTGLSQPTVSRTLSGMPDSILIGAGRGARFGLLRQIGNHGDSWPVYRVAETGAADKLGTLRALAGDNWLMEFKRDEPLYSLGLKNGISEGWPWFLDELRPQGFMGRALAWQTHRQLGASPDLNRWGADQFLLAAYIFGDDLPGNLMVGEHSIRIPASVPEPDWPELAKEAASGRPPGSSAGGERPKFSTGLELIKFAGREDAGGRWADLLLAEAIASKVLRGNRIPSVDSRIVEVGDFVFLAVRRFDRTDSGGRIGVHTLAPIDGALYGEGSGSWADMAERLLLDGLIFPSDREIIQQVWDFGRAIRNTDMHFGNLGFHPAANGTLALAPLYDMLPMAYAPNAAGLPDFAPLPHHSPAARAQPMAHQFWEQLCRDSRLSNGFRQIAERHLQVEQPPD
jgi:DNA-binding transcriptional ArsR family regulator